MSAARVGCALFVAVGGLAGARPQGPSVLTHEAQLTGTPSKFGGRVAIDADTVLVSNFDPPSLSGNYGAYCFERIAGIWTQTQVIQTSVGLTGLFGYAVALDGDIAAIGAPRVHDRLHIFERTSGVWNEAFFTNPTSDHDWLGRSVAVDQGWVAATSADSIGVPPVRVWNNLNGVWFESDQLGFGAQMVPGESVDISLPRVAAGDTDWSNGRGRMAVYLLPSFGGSPAPEDEFTPAAVVAGDLFGWSAALEGDRLVVGSPGFDSMGVASSGAAWLYERSGTNWTLVKRLESSQPVAGRQLGRGLAMQGDRVLVGGYGGVVVFEKLGGTWLETSRLAPPTPGSSRFGCSIGLDGARAIIGDPLQQRAHVYTLSQLPAPTPHCTAKVNSQGCTPAIVWSGFASASALTAFDVHAQQVLNNKSGLLFYGTNGPLAQPFQGAFMCVAGPRIRMQLESSAGNPPPDDCSGAYSVDFNARIQGGSDPALVPGAVVDAQFWMRDGAASFQTGLSDALEFTIAP